MSYLSDVRDQEWDIIKDFFKPAHPGRPRKYEMRRIYNAIRYVERTGCQWRQLPNDFPPWTTVYMTFYRQRDSGLWQQINEHLRQKLREREGKSTDPTVALVDSQSVKTVQKGGSAVMTEANI